MPKPSPQLALSAAACVLAMAALALSGPAVRDSGPGLAAPLPSMAGFEAPSLVPFFAR